MQLVLKHVFFYWKKNTSRACNSRRVTHSTHLFTEENDKKDAGAEMKARASSTPVFLQLEYALDLPGMLVKTFLGFTSRMFQ